MIEQSLCHYLQSQLTDYYRLVAILETQLSSRQDQETDPSIEDRETGLSLRRLDVWVNEWRLRMRMMSICVEGARGLFITVLIVQLCLKITPPRLTWWSTRQSNSWLHRQWGPFYQKIHRRAS